MTKLLEMINWIQDSSSLFFGFFLSLFIQLLLPNFDKIPSQRKKSKKKATLPYTGEISVVWLITFAQTNANNNDSAKFSLIRNDNISQKWPIPSKK